MEFEDLDKGVEQEARRTAAAFEVKQVRQREEEGLLSFHGQTGDIVINGHYNRKHVLCVMAVSDRRKTGWVAFLRLRDERWFWDHKGNNPDLQFIAHGFYRMGVEDENLPEGLPPLSAHEKLELRLSMPREFWPQKWSEEEVE